MQPPKLRDKRKGKVNEPYPFGNIPDKVIKEIGKWMAYNFAVGKADIDGEDWGDIFAKSIDGEHLGSPIGLADVVIDGMAWSVKSVKNDNPHKATKIRIISGRCSPDYSYNITDPHAEPEKTGQAVLNIWNERVNIAKETFEPLRASLLIRNPNSLHFTLFEHELHRFNTMEYAWSFNKNGNLEGRDRRTKQHVFTWQPHGAQFTIIYDVPASAKKFTVKRPQVLDFEETIAAIGFDDSWVTIL